MNQKESVDATVIVVGAGPTGATAAYFLAEAGVDVLMIDQATFPRDKSCGDSICPGAVSVLADMGLLEWVQNQGYAQNHAYLLSSPNGTTARIPFPHDLACHPNYLIPRREFDYALVQQAVAAGARLREGLRVRGMDRLEPQRVRVLARDAGRESDDEMTFTARLVIAADGSISSFTRRLGMVPGPADGVALRRYYEGVAGEPGLFELHWEQSVLPAYGFIFHLNDGVANVGTGMFRKDLLELKANLNERLETFVTQNVHARAALRDARALGPAVGHPFRDDAEDVTPYADNVLLVGDAAGAGHPMSGEGIGPGMKSAKLAARCAAEALEHGDLSADALAGYGEVFHAEFDGLHRAARLARRALGYPWLVDRTIQRCSHDATFAAQLAGILAGVVSPRTMLSTSTLVRVAMG
jgi:geranylgeranyl reductase family protein